MELLYTRHRQGKRETGVVAILSFILTTVWKHLFGRAGDNLEKNTESPLEYYLVDVGPNVSQFTSLPKDLEKLAVASFVGGIVQGFLDSAGFAVEHVQTHNMAADGTSPARTVILVRFLASTISREQQNSN